MTDFDIIIIGGGLAGSALAIGLAQGGRKIALVEAFQPQADSRPGFDDRTLVVNAASLNILGHLNVLDDVLHIQPLRRIEISRAGAPGHLILNADDFGHPRFGAVIVARELGAALLRRLSDNGRIEMLCPERLKDIRQTPDRAEVTLESGKKLTGKLLVGADGSRSITRRLAGIASTTSDYNQSALVFNVHSPGRAVDTAFERFARGGPLAFLPQPNERLGVVLVDRTAAIDEIKNADDSALTALLARRSGWPAEKFSSPGKRVSYPLALTRTRRPLSTRIAIVGNAANTVNPVSAQGFNLALRDVAALIDHSARAEDPGAPAVLEAWFADRRADQAATVRYTDTLARAFSNPSMLMRTGTSLGLMAHAAWPSLQKRLVRSAMGFREPVSTLARERRP